MLASSGELEANADWWMADVLGRFHAPGDEWATVEASQLVAGPRRVASH